MTQNHDARGWTLGSGGEYESGVDEHESHAGAESVYLASRSSAPKKFGFIAKYSDPDSFKGNRVRMSGWVKTHLEDHGTAQLWIRVDGDWKRKTECFDNMFENRIRGLTDWTQYTLVVDVPEGSTQIVFGVLMNGTGKVWLDDVTLES